MLPGRTLACAAALAALAAGCGSFEDPAIVIDLRILAMTAEPPEQVAPVDPDDPTSTSFAPVEVCALIADPGAARGLTWSMTACSQKSNRRCDDPERPELAMGQGELADPDAAATPQVACATLPFGPQLITILRDAIERDELQGFGGLDLNVELRVVPVGAGEDQAVYGAKAVRYSPQIPMERVANTNPRLTEIAVDTGGEPTSLPLGRCVEQAAPVTIAAGQRIHLEPIEPEGVRETYLVPTFEGGVREFTENLRYQWLAGAGDWTRGSTGGTRDAAGNEPPLDTEWKAPAAGDVDAAIDVPLWMVQRDERGGARWFESCVRVTP